MEHPDIGQEPDYTVRAPIAESIENIPFTPVQEGGMTDWNTYFSEENVNAYYEQLNAMVQAPLKFGMDVLGAAIEFKAWETKESQRLDLLRGETEGEIPNSASYSEDYEAAAWRAFNEAPFVQTPEITFDESYRANEENLEDPSYDTYKYLFHLGLKKDGTDLYLEDPIWDDTKGFISSPDDTIELPQLEGPQAAVAAEAEAVAAEAEASKPREISMSTPLSTYQWLTASAIGAVPNTPTKKGWVPGNEKGKVDPMDIIKGLLAEQPNIKDKIGTIGQKERIPISDLLREGEELLKLPRLRDYVGSYPIPPEQPKKDGRWVWEGEEYELYKRDRVAYRELLVQQSKDTAKWDEALDRYYEQQDRFQFNFEQEITGHSEFQAAKPLIPREYPTITRWFLHSNMLNLTPEQFSHGPLKKQTNMYDGLSSNGKQFVNDYLGNPYNSNITLHIAIIPTPSLDAYGNRMVTTVEANILHHLQKPFQFRADYAS